MGQEGRGSRSSFPASFFDVDEFDTNWDGDEKSGLERMREPSLMPPADSEVQASERRTETPSQEPDPYRQALGELGLATPLPLVHPDRGAAKNPPPARTRTVPGLQLEAPRRVSTKPPVLELDEGDRATIPGDPLLSEVRDRYAMGDYSGALIIADGILTGDPHNLQARRYAENCQRVLEQMCCAKLGPLHQVPEVAVAADRLRWLSLDHRAGFLLSLVDGCSSVEELLDISGMQRFEALRTLCDLLDQNVIALRQR